MDFSRKITENPKIKNEEEKLYEKKAIFRFFLFCCLFVERSRKTDVENLKLRGHRIIFFSVNHEENVRFFAGFLHI